MILYSAIQVLCGVLCQWKDFAFVHAIHSNYVLACKLMMSYVCGYLSYT